MMTRGGFAKLPRTAVLAGLAIAAQWAVFTPASQAALTHRYSFTTDASDSVGALDGTLRSIATVSGGQLQFNNPDFSPASFAGGYLSLPPSILPASGSVTIEQWGTYRGSGFFTEAYTFTDHNYDFVNPPTNPPGPNSGQYLMHAVSAPQPASPPGGPGTGGSHIAQAASGFAGSLTPPPGPETDAFGTTAGIGAGGGGYLDDNTTYMTATVIDAGAGTLSYHIFRVSDGVGGLQQTIPAIPLASYTFTNAYLGKSAFPADNWLSGSVDEFRIYSDARSTAQIAADFRAGPNQLVPEPASLGLAGLGIWGLVVAARRRNRLG
jgi:PEP-CTERM motif